MTSSRKPGKQLQSRARKPAVKRAEACGQAPGSPRSSARKPACQTCGNLRVKRAETCVSNVRKPPVGHIAGIEKNVLRDPLCAAVSEVLGTSFGPESCNPLESII